MGLDKIDPVMDEAFAVIREISADEEARLLAEAQQKIRLDNDAFYWTGLHKGEAKGAEKRSREIAKRLLDEGLPLDQIARCTGLSVEQLRELMH